jgi:hypothetical protein
MWKYWMLAAHRICISISRMLPHFFYSSYSTRLLGTLRNSLAEAEAECSKHGTEHNLFKARSHNSNSTVRAHLVYCPVCCYEEMAYITSENDARSRQRIGHGIKAQWDEES